MNHHVPIQFDPAQDAVERRRLHVRGLVQGVGFRPFVFRLAREFSLSGFVRNGPDGVIIEAQGCALDAFIRALQQSLPPLARIDSLTQSNIAPTAAGDFSIDASEHGSAASAAIPADSAICESCLTELFDPSDRRYLHPFIACTDCGPRYTMTRQLPYDRDHTSMADFPLCERCNAEYSNPDNRRFHAEPVCCHDCGPSLSVSHEHIAAQLKAGRIVAIKGIGGFHLACDASNEEAVARLRRSKRRDGKPFAIMVLNVASAQLFTQCNDAAKQTIESAARPVVVLPRRDHGKSLPETLSPGINSLGVMMPYTPLHYLLFHSLLGKPTGAEWRKNAHSLALVMTSANLSGDPLLTDNAEAETALADIADLVVTHDRDITARTDDSVLRLCGDQAVTVRRARGYAPNAIALSHAGATVLATGAHLKNSLALTRGAQAWLSPHVGDLASPDTIAFHAQCCEQLLDTFSPNLDAIACDWHRDYASTRLAEALAQRFSVPLIRVQHHHAHLAAVLAVHHHEGPALGIALDGHGLGENSESWGGELLKLEGSAFQRLGHFAPLLAPGGDRAAREPWRLAAGALHGMGLSDTITSRFRQETLAAPLAALLQQEHCPTTTAAGRLFDCAAGLLGISHHAAFEGEPPMRLESLVTAPESLPGAFQLRNGVLDFTALLAALADCRDPVQGANWFHGTLLDALTAWAIDAADAHGINTIALAGGCFLNHCLAVTLPRRLIAAGLEPLTAVDIPPNDGSISLGQAWVARQQLQPHLKSTSEGQSACV
ncbi:MAG: carbamoyltransferase HypF [Pseudomonadota bacterium]